MLTARKLGKNINNQTIISDLSFYIEPLEKVILLAPTGYGKSTLVSVLSGVDTDFTGTLRDQSVRKGVVFQNHGLFPHKTVIENIYYGVETLKIPVTDEIKEISDEWIKITGLKGYENYYPHELSRGMKQKCAIIRTFLTNPDLVIMDEPFSTLDKLSTEAILDYISFRYPDITLLVTSISSDDETEYFDRLLIITETPLKWFQTVYLSGDRH